MIRTRLLLPLIAALLLVQPAPTRGADAPEGVCGHCPVRTTDRRLLRLLHEGVGRSRTFRALVERLRASDVVVYLECGGRTSARGGRLTFVSAVGGLRYVHVWVARLPHRGQQIAMIGHELQHAVEVAEAPAIIDAESLAREYSRIGFVNRRVATGIAYDSVAAVEAGYQVLRELSDRPGGPRPIRGD